MTGNGCVPNTLRGAGTYFGPNVTHTFLKKYDLLFLIRSHECKLNGYEMCHDEKVNLVKTVITALDRSQIIFFR